MIPVLRLLLSLSLLAPAQAEQGVSLSLEVNGETRSAVLLVPKAPVPEEGTAEAPAAPPAPLVFVFHGHGGTANGLARRSPFQEQWPEAVVVYPQGLPTVGKLTDPEGKRPGWLTDFEAEKNRDLDFFDALLKEIRGRVAIDPLRIHATGHSNGGGFCYLLLAKRGEVLASVAPSASAAVKEARRGVLAPLPILHAGSKDDPLVRWSWQAMTIVEVKRSRSCAEPLAWDLDARVQIARGKHGDDVLLFQHGGDHSMHEDFFALAAKFFQATPRKPVQKE